MNAPLPIDRIAAEAETKVSGASPRLREVPYHYTVRSSPIEVTCFAQDRPS